MTQKISPTEICILFPFPYTTCMHEYGIQNIYPYLHTYLQNIDHRHGNSNEAWNLFLYVWIGIYMYINIYIHINIYVHTFLYV